MVASMFRTRVTTRQVYALGALAAGLFGYDQLAADNYFRPAEVNAGFTGQQLAGRRQFYGGLLGTGAQLLAGGA
jgi:hypothetical protein